MEAEKLFLLFSLVVLQFSSCTSQDSLKTNQTIKEGDLLISKGNNFTLGFFSPGSSSNRYLGIWYHKVPEKTVVWVANRNDPIIGSSGSLFINQYGNLVLYGIDDQKLPVWSTNVSVEENDSCAAQLLDSGNLILVTKRSRSIIWQSFDHPTNESSVSFSARNGTCLPGFKAFYRHDWYMYCEEVRKDRCGKGKGKGFVKLENVKIPVARFTRVYANVSLKE